MISMKVSALKNEMKNLSAQEMQIKLKELRHKQLNLKLSVSTGHVKDTSAFEKTRRDIARVLTYIQEKESFE